MPFDWRDFLPLARSLAGQPDEASLRSAVSRAYYSAYGVAEERRLADNIQLVPLNQAGLHKRLWATYGQHSDSRRQQIGIDGQRLHGRRIRADYRAGAQ